MKLSASTKDPSRIAPSAQIAPAGAKVRGRAAAMAQADFASVSVGRDQTVRAIDSVSAKQQPHPRALDYATLRSPLEIQHARSVRAGDRFLLFLCIVLMGYAINGKGFAYIGIPPLFIGEATMVIGAVVLLRTRGWAKLWETPPILALSAFMLFGIARTIPYLSKYGLDCIRDSCLYYYGAFAFMAAGLLIARPARLLTLLTFYRKFARVFLVAILAVFVIYHFGANVLPKWPWGEGVTIINEKEGDVLVHLAGVVAFWMSGLAGPVPSAWAIFLALDAAIMGAIDRAGTLSFGAAMGLGMIHQPRGTMGWRMIGGVLAAVILLGLSGVHIPIPNGKGREISFDQIVTNVRSTFGDVGSNGLDSTKEWRMEWWKDIVRDTVCGKYFWDGKGFGINLADEYGYQVGNRTLRSPHNAHFTVLARMGVPGLVLWILVQGAWGLGILDAYIKSRRSVDRPWSGLFLFLGAFWLAFLINSSFDVFLEGPMGGIWFWSLYGVGVGAMWIYRRHPEVLYELRRAL